MGIIVKQLISNIMLDSTDKIVDNNQQTESEAKLVINNLNPEKMEDKNNSEKNSERSKIIVIGRFHWKN